MTEQAAPTAEQIGLIYDEQAAKFAAFAEDSYTWRFIERPAFDRYIPDFYRPGVQVLDVGCGAGRASSYLVSQGVNAEGITGFDVSARLLEEATRKIPEGRFFQASMEDFDLPPESFDLAVSNMVFHHLDNESLRIGLDRVFDTLKTGGVLFFVDTDPDHSEEAKDPEKLDKWLAQKSPWGTEIPYFNRDPRFLLTTLLDLAGFDLDSGYVLKPVEEGRSDPDRYARYSSKPSRMAARYRKVSPERRDLRRSGTVPSLLSL